MGKGCYILCGSKTVYSKHNLYATEKLNGLLAKIKTLKIPCEIWGIIKSVSCETN